MPKMRTSARRYRRNGKLTKTVRIEAFYQAAEHGRFVYPSEVAADLELKTETVRQISYRLARQGKLELNASRFRWRWTPGAFPSDRLPAN